MSRKHSNISVFVPHIGCPNKCSYCNQKHITGTFKAPTVRDVAIAVKNAQKNPNYDPKTTEIAYFGGSFTAINRNYMLRLLRVAHRFVKSGTVSGIRISTRPDAIDEEILTLLKEYGVTAIELGAQSLNDRVLRYNNRGHNALAVVKASRLIKDFGFDFGGEFIYLIVGMAVAFVVSVIAIKFLMSYIKKHDFKAFGVYRIVLGAVVIGYFAVKALV